MNAHRLRYLVLFTLLLSVPLARAEVKTPNQPDFIQAAHDWKNNNIDLDSFPAFDPDVNE